MSYTKKDIINKAFTEIGLANYVFDLQPEQLQDALESLDLMMADWSGNGINIGYPLSSSSGSTGLNTELTVPDTALRAIYTNLAKEIAPHYGKVLSEDTKAVASRSYKSLSRKSVTMGKMQLDKLPKGAGNKAWRYFDRNEFINKDSSAIKIVTGGNTNLGE